MGSGLIYVGILAMWAVYLVPVLLRRHDAVNEARSVDRFSRAMRILSRRPATPDRRYVVMPQRPRGATGPVLDGGVLPKRSARPAAPEVREDVRTAARRRLVARRRRLALVLLSLTTLCLLLAGSGVVGWWAPVLTGLLLAAFAVHLRAQARQEAALRRRRAAQAARAARSRPVPAPRPEHLAPAAQVAAPAVDVEPVAVPHLPAQVDEPDELWAREEAEKAWRAAAERATREAEQAARAQGWEPMPVVVPTYVTKPKARPTRVIDLTKPGRWAEGLTAAAGAGASASELPREQAAPSVRPGLAPVPPELLAARDEPFDARAQDEDVAPRRRAVGD
ncbi:MAG: divisome protein SepX/GlpR [Motilibacteraceae bacterium]